MMHHFKESLSHIKTDMIKLVVRPSDKWPFNQLKKGDQITEFQVANDHRNFVKQV